MFSATGWGAAFWWAFVVLLGLLVLSLMTLPTSQKSLWAEWSTFFFLKLIFHIMGTCQHVSLSFDLFT